MTYYDSIFETIHWVLLGVIFFITIIPFDSVCYGSKINEKVIWKVKSVCSPILIGVNGLILICLNEGYITGFGGLISECLLLIFLGLSFFCMFFILDKR